jgi:HTH-type transcriptional regulator / antitoxin HigA
MKPKVLKNEKEHKLALKRVEALWNAPAGSPQAEQLELWASLIESYEEKHHRISAPDPVEAVKFRMEQMGLNRSDLAKFLGGRSKVSEVLNRKRPLSVAMMRNLYQNLHVPAESLLAEPSVKYRT